MSDYRTFTSESVSEGHPDKMADQISDAVVDALLAQDPDSRVACETLVKTGILVLAGEIRSNAVVDFDALARNVVREIGYTSLDDGMDPDEVTVIDALGQQSGDIARGVDERDDHEQGAGDQGLMFGYASNETDVLMPAPITYAHRLVERQAEVRRSGALPWLRPDAKSQLSFRYGADGMPEAITAIVLSTQHDPDVSDADLREGVMEEIIKAVIPSNWISRETRIHINPTGKFVIGGPVGDCGFTSKVDRSAAYAGRYVAKNIVKAGLADRCEIQVSYAIGVAEPTSISINTFGTGRLPEERIVDLIREHFDLRPRGLIAMLDLKRPIYRNTAAYGHFGREHPDFTWERTDRAEALAAAL